jgi:DNA-binding NtrC family response regulator
MSANLPVNILISGDEGVGKKLLCKEIIPECESFEATELEKSIQNKQIDIDSYNSLIIYNIENLLNKKQFFEKLKGIKIISTASTNYNDEFNTFSVKIKLEPLSKREEDLKELVKIYTIEANKIYMSNKSVKDVKIDISKNGISLQESIYKSVLLNSISKDEVMDILHNFFVSDLKTKKRSYKELLEIFEVPLLKASKEIYKSQVKMAENLDINRVTLRKKLSNYFKDN